MPNKLAGLNREKRHRKPSRLLLTFWRALETSQAALSYEKTIGKEIELRRAKLAAEVDLAERKLARAIRGIEEALSDLTLWSATENALDALKHTKDDISAMGNEEPVKQMHEEGSVISQERMDKILTDTMDTDEPDHEAARVFASSGLIPGTNPGYENMRRAYLALSDELAALKERVGRVPHWRYGKQGNLKEDQSLTVYPGIPEWAFHNTKRCAMQGGACLFEETPDA